MPKFPHVAHRVSHLKPPVFEQFMPDMRAQGAQLSKLHIGDSVGVPPYNTGLTSEFATHYPNATKYANTFGIAPLRKALADKMTRENNIVSTAENILVTSGATQGLSLASEALFEQGDEVLVFTPAWPLTFGIVGLSGARLRQIPMFHDAPESPSEILNMLEEHLSTRTAGILVNSPNNPTGSVLSVSQLEAIVRFAIDHDLWIVSDEAYDGLVFEGRNHLSIAAIAGASERTITLNTFSKLYQFAGARLGWITAPETVLNMLNQVLVHQVYNASTVAQYQVLKAVETRDHWIDSVVCELRKKRDIAVECLGEQARVKAGYFVFIRLPESDITTFEFVRRCIRKGVSIAPGSAFGRDFAEYIRICFTGETEQQLIRGLNIFARELAELG